MHGWPCTLALHLPDLAGPAVQDLLRKAVLVSRTRKLPAQAGVSLGGKAPGAAAHELVWPARCSMRVCGLIHHGKSQAATTRLVSPPRTTRGCSRTPPHSAKSSEPWPAEVAIECTVEGAAEEVTFFDQDFAGQLVVLQVARTLA